MLCALFELGRSKKSDKNELDHNVIFVAFGILNKYFELKFLKR